MKQAFHRLLSTLMAVMVLASTVSWTVDRHLCMGRVLDVSLFAHAEDCGMGMEMERGAGCCADDSFTVQGQDQLKISLDDHGIDRPFVAPMPGGFQFLLPVGGDQTATSFVDYSPPPLIRDVQLLYQTFLI